MAFRREPRGAQERSAADNSSLNRRLRNLWEREGMAYGDDVEDEDELVERVEATMHIAEQSINRVMSDVLKSKTVDFCFLIDATGSMQPHIDGVRDSVDRVVNALVQGQQSQSGIVKLRFAVVAYRDLTDNIPFETFEFNQRPEMCVNFCRYLVATGGGDTPEDVFCGLEKATQLQWAEDAGTRIIFHIADAPCHGRRFHASDIGDSHPDGDPKGRTETALFDAIKRLRIDYYFGKINSTTDCMIELFAAAYGRPITAFDVHAVVKIADSVITSITTSVDVNVEMSKLGTARIKARDFRLRPVTPNWDSLPVQVGSYLQYKLPESIEDVKDGVMLDEKRINNVRVKIAENPFAEGAERIAYYGLDLFQGYNTGEGRGRGRGRGRGAANFQPGLWPAGQVEVVLKEYKFVGHKQNSLERYRTASEVQTIAFFLADKFNKQTAFLGIRTQIKFLKVKTLLLQPSSTELRVMSCEHKYMGQGMFVKFTNNCGYSLQVAARKVEECGIDPSLLEVVMAYSHWTYHYTKGFLAVVDLQGQVCTSDSVSKVLMTDPAIHCLDTTRYAPLNLGMPGMKAFFDAHECSSVCKRLQLPAAKPRRP